MTTAKNLSRLLVPVFALIAIGLCIHPIHAATLNVGDIIVGDLGSSSSTSADTEVLKVDPATGDRTVISSDTVGGGPLMQSPQSIAIEAGGNILVLDSGLDAVLRIDPANGMRTVVSSNSVGTGPSFNSTSGITIGPTGTIYASDTGIDSVFAIDPITGNRTVVASGAVGTGPILSNPAGMAFDAAGDLLIIDFADPDEIVRLDLNTLARTQVSGSGTGTGTALARLEGGLTVAATGTIYAVAVGGTDTSAIFNVDPLTGNRGITSSKTVGTGDLLNLPYQIDEDAAGQLIVANGFGKSILSIDPATGNRTVLSSNSVGSGPAVFDRPFGLAVVSVPEPSTVLLAVVGLLGVLVCVWRRRRRLSSDN